MLVHVSIKVRARAGCTDQCPAETEGVQQTQKAEQVLPTEAEGRIEAASWCSLRLGSNPASSPIAGSHAHILVYEDDAAYVSNMAEYSGAIPPMPKANPKKMPETRPTRPGTSSCA